MPVVIPSPTTDIHNYTSIHPSHTTELTMGKNESHFHKADDVEAVKTPWPGVTDK